MAQDALQTPLDICVCGWYFWPEFIGLLKKIEHRSYIVSHRPLTTEIMDIAKGIPIVAKDNIGLEWGAYDYFLKSIWSGNSNILFCHDDILVQDPEVFNKIALLNKDVVYIFKDKAQELNNKGSKRYASHGRSIFMKSRVAKFISDCGGFRFDKDGSKDVNWAIREFDKLILDFYQIQIGVAHYPEWDSARRGKRLI